VRVAERQASRRLVVVVAAVRSVWHAPVVPVVLVALVVLACPSGREHPVLVVAVVAGRQLAVLVAPLVQLPPLAVPVAQAAVMAARICCWRHGSRVVRQRAPGWLTVAG
jgi:hypothetical protein